MIRWKPNMLPFLLPSKEFWNLGKVSLEVLHFFVKDLVEHSHLLLWRTWATFARANTGPRASPGNCRTALFLHPESPNCLRPQSVRQKSLLDTTLKASTQKRADSISSNSNHPFQSRFLNCFYTYGWWFADISSSSATIVRLCQNFSASRYCPDQIHPGMVKIHA